jgi:hypothetical protein
MVRLLWREGLHGFRGHAVVVAGVVGLAVFAGEVVGPAVMPQVVGL